MSVPRSIPAGSAPLPGPVGPHFIKPQKDAAGNETSAANDAALAATAAPSLAALRAQRGGDRAKFETLQAATGINPADVRAGHKSDTVFATMSLFRGISQSPAIVAATKAMMEGQPTTLPLMWGFRQHTPDAKLTKKERHTMQSFLNDVRKLRQQHGVQAEPVLILADLHAQHNNVPARAVPEEQGGNGREGYEAYYEKIATEAASLGIRTVRLSDIFAGLDLTPQAVLAKGAEITRLPGQHDEVQEPNVVNLTEQDLEDYALQALHMVERYPTVPVNREILAMSEADRQAALREKELGYIHFRAGEGQLVLPRLGEFFDTNVVPVHISDPSAGKIGVKGLYLHSRDYKGALSKDIPWKDDPRAERIRTPKTYTPTTLEPTQLALVKLVTSKLDGRKVDNRLLTKVAADLARGASGDHRFPANATSEERNNLAQTALREHLAATGQTEDDLFNQAKAVFDAVDATAGLRAQYKDRYLLTRVATGLAYQGLKGDALMDAATESLAAVQGLNLLYGMNKDLLVQCVVEHAARGVLGAELVEKATDAFEERK